MSLKDRVKFKLKQKSDLPILEIRKTCQHLYAYLYAEGKQFTYSTNSKLFREEHKIAENQNKRNKRCAALIGDRIGQIAKDNGIQNVVFFRGGCKYHGIIAVAADAARKHIKF